MSLCLHLFVSSPESLSPPYIWVTLVSVFLILYPSLSPGAPSCPLCPHLPVSVFPFLSLCLLCCVSIYVSVSLHASISASVSLSLGPQGSSLPSLPTSPPPACSGSRAQMAGRSRHSACKHRAMAASGTSRHPHPLGAPGSSQSSSRPAGDSHSPLWGSQQSGIGTNFSLEQTLCHH